MPLYRFTNIFQLTTAPTASSPSPARTAGWSESVWLQGTLADAAGDMVEMQRARASFLPATGKMVGTRIQLYTINQNRLIPGGSATSAVNFGSAAGYVTDVPQMCLRLSMTSNSGPGKSSYTCRGFPDQFVTGGEYDPDGAITTKINAFMTTLKKIYFGWVGRDLSQVPVQIQSYLNGVVTVAAPPPGLTAGQSFVRFYRAKLSNGDSLTGSYVVDSTTATTITLRNAPAGTITKPGGMVRKDILVYNKFDYGIVDAVFLRKVGRPLKGFRGKGSRRSA